MHLDTLVLPDPQVLQITAFVPGGDTLMSSRSLTIIHRRDRVFPLLHAELRLRFPDMLHVGFDILTAHPSSKWQDPLYCPQKDKVVIVYTDDYLRWDASVLLRLCFRPYDEEGAVYCPRRSLMRMLVRQLGLQSLCGIDGDNCLCFVNGAELTNLHEAAVEDAAFVSCWMIPITNNAAVETVTVVHCCFSTGVRSPSPKVPSTRKACKIGQLSHLGNRVGNKN